MGVTTREKIAVAFGLDRLAPGADRDRCGLASVERGKKWLRHLTPVKAKRFTCADMSRVAVSHSSQL